MDTTYWLPIFTSGIGRVTHLRQILEADGWEKTQFVMSFVCVVVSAAGLAVTHHGVYVIHHIGPVEVPEHCVVHLTILIMSGQQVLVA